MRGWVVLVTAAALGCGNRAQPPPPVERRDAGPADAARALEIEGTALGLPDVAGFRWRKRAGQPAFRLALRAEDRGDWAEVVATCQQALAADPGHLEAAWLYAVGLARLGRTDQILAPLQRAAAGDFVKWGQASLEQPALQAFLATPIGAAWRRRVEQDRRRFVDAVARAMIVAADGDLFAVEIAPRRWYRLTRSTGAVVGALALPGTHKLAYIARTRHHGVRELGVGVADLGAALSSRPVALATPGPISVAYSDKAPIGPWIRGGARAPWRQLDDDYHLHPVPGSPSRPSGPWLEVTARGAARLHTLPANVTADWDEQSLASAIRIGTSNRVVTVPSPGLIDGNTAAWSPDGVHFAFAAQLDDHCAPGAVNTAAFVADAATGGLRELQRAATGIAVQWLADRKLAVAGDRVAIYSLDDAPPILIDGADGLVIPRERPRCAAPEPPEPTDEPEPAETLPGDEATDAGVTDAR